MLRSFALFVVAAFGAVLVMAGLYALLGVIRPPLTGGLGLALLDVLLYSCLTFVLWGLLSRRLRAR